MSWSSTDSRNVKRKLLPVWETAPRRPENLWCVSGVLLAGVAPELMPNGRQINVKQVQVKREIPACERVRGYGDLIRTRASGCSQSFESAVIGGS